MVNKSYKKRKLYYGGQNKNTQLINTSLAPATNISQQYIQGISTDINSLGTYKQSMIRSIQNALVLADPTLLTNINTLQGSLLAQKIESHLADPTNNSETLQELYSFIQNLYSTQANINMPNLNFNLDGSLKLVAVSPSPFSSGGRRKSRKSRKSRK